ncbi:unnamed protein product [Zymoseptoria tritici ST99CH_1E4]|uniref:RING-type domain-containing protein n=1 Tax=Zymoseptoria tritici ST99CH_1E4 TaxID=1276532 RepID=A0A2H1FJ62_ZYMTR|nr:unnamed protein product [Zymoseptoria tritici ST99CH_1E4]
MTAERTFNMARNIFSKTKQALEELEEPLIPVSASHHRIQVCHPAVTLLRRGENLSVQKLARGAITRYDPTIPLVRNAAVAARAGRDNQVETTMASFYESTTSIADEVPNLVGTFFEDMQELVRFHGQTVLLTLKYVKDGEKTPRMRLMVHSLLYRPDTGPLVNGNTYEMTVDEFVEAGNQISGHDYPPWMCDLEDLCTRSTDRACRHVAFHIHGPHMRGAYSEHPELGIGKFLPQDERNCLYCTESFLDESHEPTIPACGVASHVICRSCVFKQCETRGPEQASCPMCRRVFFENPEHLDFLVYGTVRGEYQNDVRYTKWENLQRSFADLDRQSAIGDADTCFHINNTSLLFNMWLTLISDELADGAENDDKRLDYTPEFRKLLLAVESGLRSRSGRTPYRGPDFAEGLRFDIQHSILENFLPNYMDSWRLAATMEETNRLDAAALSHPHLFRPGMAEAIQRSIQRLARALQVRMCGCGAQGDDFGKHWHGGRYFWDPEELAREGREWTLTGQVKETERIRRRLEALEAESRVEMEE